MKFSSFQWFFSGLNFENKNKFINSKFCYSENGSKKFRKMLTYFKFYEIHFHFAVCTLTQASKQTNKQCHANYAPNFNKFARMCACVFITLLNFVCYTQWNCFSFFLSIEILLIQLFGHIKYWIKVWTWNMFLFRLHSFCARHFAEGRRKSAKSAIEILLVGVFPK